MNKEGDILLDSPNPPFHLLFHLSPTPNSLSFSVIPDPPSLQKP